MPQPTAVSTFICLNNPAKSAHLTISGQGKGNKAKPYVEDTKGWAWEHVRRLRHWFRTRWYAQSRTSSTMPKIDGIKVGGRRPSSFSGERLNARRQRERQQRQKLIIENRFQLYIPWRRSQAAPSIIQPLLLFSGGKKCALAAVHGPYHLTTGASESSEADDTQRLNYIWKNRVTMSQPAASLPSFWPQRASVVPLQ